MSKHVLAGATVIVAAVLLPMFFYTYEISFMFSIAAAFAVVAAYLEVTRT